jgi:hypothetical protein
VLLPDQDYVVMQGLKLNKMGLLKQELDVTSLKNLDFKIRFVTEISSWETTPFKIVSNCSQLPGDLRKIVRPSKT